MTMASTSSRPGLITFIAVLVYINAVLTIIGGTLLIVAGLTPELQITGGEARLATGTGIVAIIIGVVTLVIARGLLSGSNFARGLITGIEVLTILNGIASIFQDQLWVGIGTIAFAVIVIAVLFAPRANAFFRS